MASKDKPLFAFFGTPVFSVHVLNALEARGFLPALIITAPDKPRGRGQEMSPSPAKAWALERDIEVLEPASLKGGALAPELGNTEWDVFIVAAYGKLIPKELLEAPRCGVLNVHPSLLPKFRGPSPIVSVILADERETGVSILKLSEAMDAGPVIAQARIEIEETEWPLPNETLGELLFTEGGNLLAEILPDWCKGKLPAEPQDESRATYTKKFSDEDALVELSADARKNMLKIRAFDKNPRAHFFAQARDGRTIRVGIADAKLENDALMLTRVIPEGKKEMPYADFMRGL